MKDNVNSPSHYSKQCSIECIDSMEVAFGIRLMFYHCIITAYKYIWRYRGKNGREDLDKAEWYIRHAMTYMDDESLYDEDKEKFMIVKKLLYKQYDSGYQE